MSRADSRWGGTSAAGSASAAWVAPSRSPGLDPVGRQSLLASTGLADDRGQLLATGRAAAQQSGGPGLCGRGWRPGPVDVGHDQHDPCAGSLA